MVSRSDEHLGRSVRRLAIGSSRLGEHRVRYLVAGEIRKINKDIAKITIKYAETKNLDMSPMTMVFQVKEPGLLDKVEASDEVRFKAAQTGIACVVTAIEPVR